MVLIDTSVWTDYLRSEEPHLVYLLNESQVLVHPFVIGELALGNLRNREEVLSLLGGLPVTPVATEEEVLFFVERHRLMEHGICYVDARLLAAVTLAESTLLWTGDRRLLNVAAGLNLAYQPSAMQ